MDWIPVDSRVFTAAAYNPTFRVLYLRFRSGDIYSYSGFAPETFQEFLGADSKGQYFAFHIRDRYHCEHLSQKAAP